LPCNLDKQQLRIINFHIKLSTTIH
jgi:hypothetical protein